MKKRWAAIMITMLILVLTVVGVALAGTQTVYNFDPTRMYGRGTLNWNGSSANMTGMTYLYSSYYPADMRASATLYKGGRYVDHYDSPLMVNSSVPVSAYISASSAYTGTWTGIGWHFADWPAEIYTESCNTYCYESDRESAHMELMSHHQDILSRLRQDYVGWHYAVDLSQQSTGAVLTREAAVRLDLLYHVDILPKVMQQGDWFPFLMISPDATEVDFVFPKSDGRLMIVRATVCDGQPHVVR